MQRFFDSALQSLSCKGLRMTYLIFYLTLY